MIEQDKLKEIIEDIFEMAKQNLVRDKELHPILFLLGDEGIKGIAAVAVDLNDGKVKDAVADAIKQMCKETEAFGYLFLSEAWMVTRKAEDDLSDIQRVSDCDDKFEIINMVGQYVNTQIQGRVQFNRIKIENEDKTIEEQIVCGGTEITTDFESFDSRFMNLL